MAGRSKPFPARSHSALLSPSAKDITTAGSAAVPYDGFLPAGPGADENAPGIHRFAPRAAQKYSVFFTCHAGVARFTDRIPGFDQAPTSDF